MPSIEDRLSNLEKFRSDVEKSVDIELGADLRLVSRVAAIETFILEIAAHLGVDRAHASARLANLQKAYHDNYLKQAESVQSSFAAHIDDRDVEEVPSGEHIEPLFPPKE